MKVIAVIPVKDLRRSKERLSSILSQEEREKLVLWMLKRLFEALKHVSLYKVIVLSPNEKVVRIAETMGFMGIMSKSDLNGAIAEGLDLAQGIGADAAIILPADIPLVKPQDLRELLEVGLERPFFVLVPSKDGGTNAIFLSLPTDFTPEFGEHSFERHLKQAKRYNYLVVRNERLEFDVDGPEDLSKLKSFTGMKKFSCHN